MHGSCVIHMSSGPKPRVVSMGIKRTKNISRFSNLPLRFLGIGLTSLHVKFQPRLEMDSTKFPTLQGSLTPQCKYMQHKQQREW